MDNSINFRENVNITPRLEGDILTFSVNDFLNSAIVKQHVAKIAEDNRNNFSEDDIKNNIKDISYKKSLHLLKRGAYRNKTAILFQKH